MLLYFTLCGLEIYIFTKMSNARLHVVYAYVWICGEILLWKAVLKTENKSLICKSNLI